MAINLAGCIIPGKNDEILLIHRNTARLKQWEIPGGKIEDDEDSQTAAIREAKEELGVDIEIEKLLGEKDFVMEGLAFHFTWYLGHIAIGRPQIMEPETFDEFDYFPLSGLHHMINALSPNARNFVAMVKTGKISLAET